MELVAELMNNQFALYIPVALALVCVVLVFVFGFKSAEQPPFDQLSSIDDRKATNKKRKIKDKKTANGFAVHVAEVKTEKFSSKDKEAKKSPAKEAPNTPKNNKKQETNSPKQADKKKAEPPKVKAVEETKNKKNVKKIEKPSDYDEGDWETVLSKNDKKKKVDSPPKPISDKKIKKAEKAVDVKEKETDKFIKQEIEKQLQEDDKENKVDENNKKNASQVKALKKDTEEIIPVIEEKKPKKDKKQKKEKEVEAVSKSAPEVVHVEKEIVKEGTEIKEEALPATKTQSSGEVAFDELGDVWTEAKAVKKSKKKSRRDN